MTTKKSDTLSSIYILPLIELNKDSFGKGNFIGSYLSMDLRHIVVEVKEAVNLENHREYVMDFTTEQDTVFIVFRLPSRFKVTAIKFSEGKYSEFSSEAKTLIKQKSGLRYKVPGRPGRVLTDRELLVLDKDPDLKKIMEIELEAVGQIPRDAELLDVPSSKNFIDLKIDEVCQHH